MLYNLRYGNELSKQFVTKIKSKKYKDAFSLLSNTKHNPNPIFEKMSNNCTCKAIQYALWFIYKWPVLCFSASILTYYYAWQENTLVGLILSIVCLLLVVLEFIHELVARLMLGYLDNYRRYIAIDPSGLNDYSNVFLDRNRLLKDFLLTILIQLFCFIWAFSSLYYYLSAYDVAMFNVPINTVVSSLYFSIVTTGTIGFGDINPTLPLSRALVSFHIITIWLFTIFLMAHFFATLSETPENINIS